MMDAEIKTYEIVVLGDFNPKIFTPTWFAAEELLKESEAENADIEIIHPDVAAFRIQDWLKIQVFRNRFLLLTEQDRFFEVVSDLFIGVFTKLRHTPVTAMGINWTMHFRSLSKDEWHALGDYLAPKELWKEIMASPGLMNLDIQGSRADKLNGYYKVIVSPSDRIDYGVRIKTNDHFNVSNCDEMTDIFKEHWQSCKERANKTAETILKYSKKEKECPEP